MNNQVMRRLEALEESMGTGEGTRPEIELVFVKTAVPPARSPMSS